MASTPETTAPAETTTVVKSKLVVKDLGNPRVAASFTAEEGAKGKRHFLGTIMGIADRVRSKVDNKGEIFESISGQFEGTTVEGNVIQSGILYLPGGIHEMVAEPLKKENASPIQFGIRVFSVKAENPIGYSYLIEPVYKPEQADPLAEIRKAMASATVKRIGAPKEVEKEKAAKA